MRGARVVFPALLAGLALSSGCFVPAAPNYALYCPLPRTVDSSGRIVMELRERIPPDATETESALLIGCRAWRAVSRDDDSRLTVLTARF